MKLEFEGGPYPRPITVLRDGRVVGAFPRAHHLDVARYEREVLEIVRRLIEGDRGG